MVRIDSNEANIEAIILDDVVSAPSTIEPDNTALYTKADGLYTVVSGSSPIGPLSKAPTTGIADTNTLVVNGTLADDDIAYATATGIEGKTVTELIALFRAAGLIGIGDNDILEVDGTLNQNEWAYSTTTGIEGKTDTEFVALLRAAGLIGIGDNDILEVDGTVADNDILRATTVGVEGLTYAQLKTATGYLTDLADDASPSLVATLNCNTNDIDNARSITFIAEVDNGNSSTADTIDWGAGQKQKSNMTNDCTYTFTDPDGPCNLVLKLIQGSGFPHNPTWTGGGTTVKWEGGDEPTWSTGSAEEDIISFYFDGTNYYGSAGIGFA
jgi:hypothetical protein